MIETSVPIIAFIISIVLIIIFINMSLNIRRILTQIERMNDKIYSTMDEAKKAAHRGENERAISLYKDVIWEIEYNGKHRKSKKEKMIEFINQQIELIKAS